MGTQHTRKAVLERLNAVRKKNRPLLIVCPGSGLNAKLCEIGGADLIQLVHTGLMRQKGLPSIARLDGSTNDAVKSMMKDQFRATKSIPIICGINVAEFSRDGDLNELIDSFMPYGFSGVLNYPSAGEVASDEFVAVAEKGGVKDELAMFDQSRENERNGVGYAREIELIKTAHDRDIFTMAYAFTPEQAADMAQAGADMIAGHCGGTGGGLVGHGATVTYEEGGKRLQEIALGARDVNPNIIVLGHGGPFAKPEDTMHMYEYCRVDGFIAGSAIDRIPIEEAVVKAAEAYKSHDLKH